MLRLWSTYFSTLLDSFFDCGRLLFRLCSTSVLDLCLDCGRFNFLRRSTYLSTVLDFVVYLFFYCARPNFECPRPMFWLCSTWILTVFGLICDCARATSNCDLPMFPTVLDLYSDCGRSIFWLCSTHPSTLVDLCFGSARPLLRLWSIYFSTALDLSLYCAQLCRLFIFLLCSTYFRMSSTYVSTVLN